MYSGRWSAGAAVSGGSGIDRAPRRVPHDTMALYVPAVSAASLAASKHTRTLTHLSKHYIHYRTCRGNKIKTAMELIIHAFDNRHS